MAGRPKLVVLAGVNGAGKSSIGGALLRKHGMDWFNPDEHTHSLVAQGYSPAEANAAAWQYGTDLLRQAIAAGTDFAFETTLGGNTVPGLIAEATRTHDVALWFCGLATVEMHIERVAQRVARGGHDIPEAKIRERWNKSRENLIRLLPDLAELRVMDNSARGSLGQAIPQPLTVLRMKAGKVLFPDATDLDAMQQTPAWAQAIVEAALEPPASSPG